MREEFNCTLNTTTITRTWTRFKDTGSVADRSRSGRPKKCSSKDERVVRRLALANRALSLRRLAGVASTSLTHSLSRDSIKLILLRYGFRRRISARVPFLNKKQRKKSGLGVTPCYLACSSMVQSSVLGWKNHSGKQQTWMLRYQIFSWKI